MPISKEVIYALECGHAAPAPATLVSGTLNCAWCRELKLISGVIVYEWHATCKSCNFGRWAGLSKHNAQIFANGHYRNNTGHEPYVEYTRNPNAERTDAKFRAWTGRNAS